MKNRKRSSNLSPMLDLWRPPEGAGEPVGCLATTYTFAPGLFEEHCLARFLEIESEPNREDLAHCLERESRMGGVYAGVLVDHTQAGVEHSLRWDVLPVRVRGGKQHAKLSLLAWSHHLRIIVSSANLSEPGYRSNQEVAAAVDLTPMDANTAVLADAIGFLRRLVRLVPGAAEHSPETERLEAFLSYVERHAQEWKQNVRRGPVRQQLVFTLPAAAESESARSSLEEVVGACRRRGGSPFDAWIASPFFDDDHPSSRVTVALCKLMARGRERRILFCVPAMGDNSGAVPRLGAPKVLLETCRGYRGDVKVKMLPEFDTDKNRRPWHAKLLALRADEYSALMIGSSNYTCAGLGVGKSRNAEANLLTIADFERFGRDAGRLEAVWPEMEDVVDPESAEWLGARTDQEEEEQAGGQPLPEGFLSATYRAGAARGLLLRLQPEQLPVSWQIHACGSNARVLLAAAEWHDQGRSPAVELVWEALRPPERLLVRWADHEAFWPLNVEDSRELPPPPQLEGMSADEMLWIMASPDPSSAFRTWVGRQQPVESFDSDLDSATPIDLDPLRTYDLQSTFLHRIRRRARILAQLRTNLERPVPGRQSLEWRLRGIVGVESLADRLLREFESVDRTADELLLNIADLMIVLHEVDYLPSDGCLSKHEFEGVFSTFLKELAGKLGQKIDTQRHRLSEDVLLFWKRVEARCQA